MSTRSASHKNSWYSGNGRDLDRQLTEWLSNASATHAPARAIISPHAGYSYSGPCAAHAFKNIQPDLVDRVFVLGPSHHFYLGESCAITSANVFETPLYNLKIDHDVRNALLRDGEFLNLSQSQDEDEHSIEMQFPYIAKVMESRANNFTVIPIMVGSLSLRREKYYGNLFAPYLADPRNLFVISSDFCHWGSRFNYTYYDKSYGEIWQSIKNLDSKGMELIESLNPLSFEKYLQDYQNTICGRHPISVLLHAIEALRTNKKVTCALKFVQYDQSSKCRDKKHSSVSYASASLTIN